jgi:hypothetical protein
VAGKLSANLSWQLANPLWASQINPLFTSVANLENVAINGGYQIKNISLTASTPKAVAHTLGSVPIGWFVVDNTANATIWRTAWTQQTITLESSANTTISIWVF